MPRLSNVLVPSPAKVLKEIPDEVLISSYVSMIKQATKRFFSLSSFWLMCLSKLNCYISALHALLNCAICWLTLDFIWSEKWWWSVQRRHSHHPSGRNTSTWWCNTPHIYNWVHPLPAQRGAGDLITTLHRFQHLIYNYHPLSPCEKK